MSAPEYQVVLDALARLARRQEQAPLVSQDCPRCDGGVESPDPWGCLDCGGHGRVLAPPAPDLKPCPDCGGEGCDTCSYDGVIYPY